MAADGVSQRFAIGAVVDGVVEEDVARTAVDHGADMADPRGPFEFTGDVSR
jgi:hypothetical protein